MRFAGARTLVVGPFGHFVLFAGWLPHFTRNAPEGPPAQPDDAIDDAFWRADADGNGEIDYSEFVVATMNEKNLLSNNKLQTAFKMFDKDGGGSISTDEIKQVLSFG